MPRCALLLLAALCAAPAWGGRPQGGRLYNTTSRPARGVVNVHLLCHSHDDVGWLKAPHEYFLGSRVIGLDPGGTGLSLYYANGAVQYILTSVVDALSANPDRKFVVVEQFFFQRWWEAQDDAVQARVRALVAARQLVFAGGGLVMADEACPTFQDMLDQASAGIRFLADTFGPAALPRVASQLDDFGHSATQASMLASPLAGYIAQFQARMDAQEGAQRRATQTMDFAWAPSASLGLSALTLGSLGNTGYSAPDGFCFDIGIECQAESAAVYSGTGLNNPINDDAQRGLPDAVDDNVLAFVAQVQKTVAGMLGAYTRDADGTVHLPWTMGDDFDYGAAQMNFGSLDKLIHYVNLNTSQHGINLFYSTQEGYATARLAMEAPLSLKTCDGFPYASDGHSVWSGFFTSRPALKGYVRASSALFAAARVLQAWAAPPAPGAGNALGLLEAALGVAQHHDAVSGTSKQVVANDYARRLAAGRAAAQGAMGGWVNALLGLPPPGSAGALAFAACDLANATLCAPLQASADYAAVVLALVSAQSQPLAAPRMRLPVAGAASWRVLAGDGVTPLPAQLVPFSPADLALRAYHGAPPPPPNASWLCFYAPRVPPAGYALAFLQPVAAAGGAPETHASALAPAPPAAPGAPPLRLTNGAVTLTLDGASGLLAGFASSDPASLPAVNLSQELLAYTPSTGDAASPRPSGAYIFRPNASQAAAPLRPRGGPSAAAGSLTGPLLSEAWQQLAPWAWQRVTLWSADSDGFELGSVIGPLPAGGAEVVSRFTAAGWRSAGAWDTDANGREWQPRRRSARPDFNLTLTEPVAQNYYPCNTALRLADSAPGGSGGQLTLLTDRTQGCASLADGAAELMLHRRLLHDDGLGVLEALDERGADGGGLRVALAHRVLLTPGGAAGARAHRGALAGALLPLQWLAAALPAGVAPGAWVAARAPGFAPAASALAPAALPPALQLLTLHSLNVSAALLRLAHCFEAGEAGAGASDGNATVALAELLAPPGLRIRSAVEMTLTGGQPLRDVQPVTYRLAAADGGNVTLPVLTPAPAGEGLLVTLAPMQVRTFVVGF